ncbi:hypothetical protein [Cognatiluteimonas telluris]|uniref:hypothetical protein n=1 Tax=Cognatiluteimonas telluris TaxID=1104775 RepID=UPI00140C5212|nr:hypothetical protein [Lysobacter telluris]
MTGASTRPRGEGIGQRLLVLVVFAAVAGLVWLAHSGRYDAQVNRLAAGLHHLADAVLHWRH